MPKIIWSNHYRGIVDNLHSGVSVADTAKTIGVSYSSLCKFLSSVSLDNKGKFKKRISSTPELEQFFGSFILKQYGQQTDICNDFGASPSQVQNMMRSFSLTKEWDLKNSTSEMVAIGRKAELYVKSLPQFKILADKIKTDSKSPYDLVVAGYGAVDVKATKLRDTPSGGYRWKFNVENVTKPTKHVFLVGYDEVYENPLILVILPYKEVKGKKSISISKTKLSESKYAPNVFLQLYSEESVEGDILE